MVYSLVEMIHATGFMNPSKCCQFPCCCTGALEDCSLGRQVPWMRWRWLIDYPVTSWIFFPFASQSEYKILPSYLRLKTPSEHSNVCIILWVMKSPPTPAFDRCKCHLISTLHGWYAQVFEDDLAVATKEIEELEALSRAVREGNSADASLTTQVCLHQPFLALLHISNSPSLQPYECNLFIAFPLKSSLPHVTVWTLRCDHHRHPCPCVLVIHHIYINM